GQVKSRVSGEWWRRKGAIIAERAAEHLLSIPHDVNVARFRQQLRPQMEANAFDVVAVDVNRVVSFYASINFYASIDVGLTGLAVQNLDPVGAGGESVELAQVHGTRERVASLVLEKGQCQSIIGLQREVVTATGENFQFRCGCGMQVVERGLCGRGTVRGDGGVIL